MCRPVLAQSGVGIWRGEWARFAEARSVRAGGADPHRHRRDVGFRPPVNYGIRRAVGASAVKGLAVVAEIDNAGGPEHLAVLFR
jgi:hypothetical protein